MAALVLFFLGMSTDGQLDKPVSWPASLNQAALAPANLNAAPAAVPPVAAPAAAPVTAAQPVTSPIAAADDNGLHILSPGDADLYRAAFAAQEKGDWAAADAALAAVKERGLVGHVLADRYTRRAMTLPEAQQWLAAYADLPEAATIYNQARHLRGFAAARLTRPSVPINWTGANDYGSSLGFRALADSDDAAQKNHALPRINAALRRDPLIAREMLATEMQRGSLSAADAAPTVARIAAAFFYQGQTERAQPLAHMAAENGAALGLWIDGLSAWKKQDYQPAARSFASLAQAPGLSNWDRAAASYWAYRAAKHDGDEPQSRHWLAEAAKYPHSFYGYMAANVIGRRPSRSWKMPDLNAHSIEVLAHRPAGWQALALVQIGKNDLAENELRRLSPVGQRDLQLATLALAEKAHMPSLAVQLGGIATNDNGQIYDAAMYPLPPWQPAGGFKIDRALIYALIKRESQFDPAAVSQSGACGLMQIMPSTAHQISDEKIGSACSGRLFDPATNMALGQKYVRVLAGQPMIGDNLLLLLASYNGGPGNVAHWLGGEDHSDPLLFLESMPVRETHDYVQQVLMHYWMYRSRLSEPENSVAQLARGEWPRYALDDSGIGSLRQADARGVEKLASE